jgi:hypothetical protein
VVAPKGKSGVKRTSEKELALAKATEEIENVFGPVALGVDFLFSEYIQFLANSKICVGFI